MSDSATFQAEFHRRLDRPWELIQLFDFLPEAYFYAKDVHGRFVRVNRALAEMRGFRHEDQMVGKTDFDIHARRLAEQYVEEDRRVMQGRVPIPNQVWLVPDGTGRLTWFVSSKIPLFGDGGQVIGIAGVMRDFEKAKSLLRPYEGLEAALAYVVQHLDERITVGQLAELVHLSISQFDRRFKQLFQMTPQQYILHVRMNAACQALSSTELSVAEIAAQTGFYDQSYFTKQFRRHTGLTPLVYRRKYREDASRL